MYCGKHIQALRLIKGFSQNEIAVKLRLKQQAISKWEKRKRIDIQTITRFLAAAGATRKELDEIIKLSPPPANNSGQ